GCRRIRLILALENRTLVRYRVAADNHTLIFTHEGFVLGRPYQTILLRVHPRDKSLRKKLVNKRLVVAPAWRIAARHAKVGSVIPLVDYNGHALMSDARHIAAHLLQMRSPVINA